MCMLGSSTTSARYVRSNHQSEVIFCRTVYPQPHPLLLFPRSLAFFSSCNRQIKKTKRNSQLHSRYRQTLNWLLGKLFTSLYSLRSFRQRKPSRHHQTYKNIRNRTTIQSHHHYSYHHHQQQQPRPSQKSIISSIIFP